MSTKKKVRLPQVATVELEPKTTETVPLSIASTNFDEKEDAGTAASPEFVASLKLTQSLTILTDDHDTIIETAIDKISCCLSFLLDERSPFNEQKQNFQERCQNLCVTTEDRVDDAKQILEKHENHIKSLYDVKYEAFWEDMYKHFSTSASKTGKSSIFQIAKTIESEIVKVNKVREAIDSRRANSSFIGTRPGASTPMVFESVTDIAERRGRDPNELQNIDDVQSMRKWLKSLRPGLSSYQEIDDALAFFSSNDSITKMKQYDIEDVKSLKMSILMGNRPMSQWQWFHVVPWIEKIDRLNRFASLFWEWQISGLELCSMDDRTIELLIQCSHGYTKENDRLTDLISPLINEIERNLLLSVVTYEYESIYELIAMLAFKEKKDENADKAEIIYELLQFLRAKPVDGPKVLWKLDVFYLNKIDNILAVLLIGSKIRKLFHVYFPRYLLDPQEKNAPKEPKKSLPGSPQITREDVSFALSYEPPPNKYDMEVKRGIIDMFMDGLGEGIDACCCAPCKCGTFIKQFDRITFRVIWMLVLSLSWGCLITWFWMHHRSRAQISVAITKSAKAIAGRAIQAMEYEFFVPQMLINVAIGGLFNGDLSLGNPNDYVSNGQYDEFFVQYRQYAAAHQSVYALYVYESRNKTVIGTFTADDGVSSVVYVFNGSCGHEYGYDETTKQRDPNDMSFEGCWYYPESRAWFTKAQALSLYESGWTEPYQFSENNQIGLSLVHRIDHDGFDVIFIAEFTIQSIESIFYTFENVKGGITYLITPGGSVIASDIGEIDCDDDSITDCSASHPLLLDSVELLRSDEDVDLNGLNDGTVIKKQDEFVITLYSFFSVYLHSSNVEYGAIAVVYDNDHLTYIQSAELWTLIVYIASTLLIVCILCCLDRCKIHGMSDEEIFLQKTPDPQPIEESQETDENPPMEEERKFKTYILAQLVNVYKCSVWYVFVVFLMTFVIWEKNVNPLWHETMDIFYNEEYLIVQDKVMGVVHTAQTITDIVEERFMRGDMDLLDETIGVATDAFLSNIMESFKDADDEYFAYMVYIATPNGMMIGAQRESNDSLRIVLRDNSTQWQYKQYPVNATTLERDTTDDALFEINEWDPRCRIWYELALSYMFDGDVLSAFGGSVDNLLHFHDTSNNDARLSRECIDAVAYYGKIWNVSDANLESVENNLSSTVGLEVNSIYSPQTDYNLVWTQYLFSSTGTTGLTATKAIIDRTSGALLAVVSVDFELDSLSNYLNATNTHDDLNSTNTWIMRADNYEMLASSDKRVTAPIDNDVSCVTISGTCYEISNLLPYKATQHPNFYINVISQEVELFYAADDDDFALPINTSTSPAHLKVPLDLPESLSGRLVTYPSLNANASDSVGLDWIIVKLMNVDEDKKAEEDDSKVISFLLAVILYAVYRIQSRLEQVNADNNVVQQQQQQQDIDESDETLTHADIDDAKKYRALKREMEEMVEYSSVKTWSDFNRNFQSEIGNHPIRTSMATDFMAKQSNMHVETKKHGDLTMMLYALQLEHHAEGAAGKLLRFLDAALYNWCMNAVICLHMLFIMYLPVSPQILSSREFSDPGARSAMIAIGFVVIIEIADVILLGAARWIEFGGLSLEYSKRFTRLKYGQRHRFVDQIATHSPIWLTFFGTASWKHFIVHIVLIALIIVDTALMMLAHIGIFTYYIPVVPILLVVRSQTIREFSIQFFYAIYYAKEILISYFVLILIVSILASAVFAPILNPHQSVDTFASSIRALISSFVFVSTGENYNEIVYSAIGKDVEGNETNFWFENIHKTIGVLNLGFFVIVSIIGLYFFIPIMIFKFENAFDHSRRVNDNVVSRNKLRSKINLSIAAFIWLDMTDDGTISKKEFDLFAHSSVISRSVLLDAFEYSDDIDAVSSAAPSLDLYEFVSTMINGFHLFTVGIDSHKCYGSKFQSILECNVFRRDRNRHYLLIYCIIPSILVALLRGLLNIEVLNVMVHVFFVINFIDINLRWYAFGWQRYLSLIPHRAPPRVQQAIYSWMRLKGRGIHYMRGEEEELQTLELTHAQREWVSHNLLPTRPQTLWQKRTLSVIHRAELYLIWFSAAGWLLSGTIFPHLLGGYYYFFIQLYLFRLFTLVTDNQRLFALIFAILPHTINILAFLFIFMFFYARIGCTLFANKTDYVISAVYSTVSNANFNTLGSSILTLMQLMIGEGWHEIMYLHMIATRVEYCAYFVVYIVVVTLIISNIFIGLFLSEIEDLDNQQTHDEFINQWIDTSSRDSKIVAAKRRNKLLNQLNQLKQAIKTTHKQIQKIDKIFLDYKRDR
eukprot:828482_1